MREKLDQSVLETRENAFYSGPNVSTPADKSFQPFVSVDGVDGPCGGDVQSSSQKTGKGKGIHFTCESIKSFKLTQASNFFL